jgi:nitrogen fixation/metabolism regulation signal transduction histidine kinase
MRFLARDERSEPAAFPIEPLLRESFQEACRHVPTDNAGWTCENGGGEPLIVTGDRTSLKHALAEIMLNALQANPREPKVRARLQLVSDKQNSPHIQIEIEDNGEGFSADAAQKVPTPFFTTRSVGLGLGLTVSRKIVETHRGRLEIPPPKPGQHGLVRVLLPASPSLAAAV